MIRGWVFGRQAPRQGTDGVHFNRLELRRQLRKVNMEYYCLNIAFTVHYISYDSDTIALLFNLMFDGRGSICGSGTLITPPPESKRIVQYWPERKQETILPGVVRL